MLQQKSFVSEERKKGNGNGSQHSSGNKRRSGSFTSSTALTPGTPFMHDVCVSISHFVCAKLGQEKWRHVSGAGGTAPYGSVTGSEGTLYACSRC
jgi:5'-3' exonuclease